jgi:RNA polymerase sigma-70 factor (ECF subfamily)
MTGDASTMWEEFAAPLRAFVARRVPPGIEPDDVVQEVFLRVVRHLPALRDAERLEAWLYQIARNALRDAMRVRQRRDLRTDALDVEPPAASDVEDVPAAEAELAPCLTGMVARLPEPYRTAMDLTSREGLTQAEAAKRAGVSVSGMKSRVQRARDQLKQMLVRCCEVAVDSRGGVSDFHLREPGACGIRDDARVPVRPTAGSSVFSSDPAAIPAAGRNEETAMSDVTQSKTTNPQAGRREAQSACCGGPAPIEADACCARDAEAKSAGAGGCGCETAPAPAAGGCC